MIVDQRRPDVLVIDEVFSESDLDVLSRAADNATFEAQALGPRGLRVRHRAVFDDPSITAMLWERLNGQLAPLSEWKSERVPNLDPPAERWSATGLNPNTRVYKYGLGGSFSYHEDYAWQPSPDVRSMLTVLVYLSDGHCVGGETVVDGEVVSVENGRVAIFNHEVPHEGKPVEQGTKIVLRSDVVYTVTH